MYVGGIVVTFALGKVDWPECAGIDVRRCDLCAPPPRGYGPGHGKVDRSEESVSRQSTDSQPCPGAHNTQCLAGKLMANVSWLQN